MSRSLAFDIAKGLCIILVVIGHFCPVNSPEWYKDINGMIYSFHMPLFMFASGYIYRRYRRESDSYFTFIKRKVYRLLIPYLTTSVLVITLKLVMESSLSVDHPVQPISYLKILYEPEAGFFLWFVWALWWMFVIVDLCRSRLSRLIVAIVSLLCYLIPFTLPPIFALPQLRINAVFFMAGVLCVDWYTTFGRIISSRVLTVVNLLAFVALELWVFVFDTTILLPVWYKILPFMGIGVVMYISRLLSSVSIGRIQWLLTVSGCSYLIYLLHTTFEGFIKGIISKFVANPEAPALFPIVSIIVIAGGVVLPMFTQVYVINRSRLLCFLFGLKYKRK